MLNADLLKRLSAKEIEFSAAVEESLMWDPLTEDTLLLFETGDFWERVIADALLEEYGLSNACPAIVPSMADFALWKILPGRSSRAGIDAGTNYGRNVRIEDEESLISGEIDVLTPGPNGSLVAWEIKSTKAYSMDNYGPSESHIIQLAIYKHLWNSRSPEHDIDDAYLVYVPNDKHAQAGRVLSKMKVIHLDDALADAGLSHEQVVLRLELAQQYVRECSLDDPPPAYQDASEWPCSKSNRGDRVRNCPFFSACFGSSALKENKVWDIPF